MLALLNPASGWPLACRAAGRQPLWRRKPGAPASRAEWDRDIAERTAQSPAASEAACAKEQALQAENTRIRSTYAREAARARLIMLLLLLTLTACSTPPAPPAARPVQIPPPPPELMTPPEPGTYSDSVRSQLQRWLKLLTPSKPA